MASFATDPGHADIHPEPDAVSADSTHSQNGQNGTDQLGNGSGEHDTDNDGPGKKKKGTKRRKVNHACLYCRRSHMTCDEGRPCQRWCESLPLPLDCRDSSRGQHKARDRPPLPRRTENDGKRQGVCVFCTCPKQYHESSDRRRETSWRVYVSPPMYPRQPSNTPLADLVARLLIAGQYGSASVPMNSTWPRMGLGMAQGGWLYPPETLSNEIGRAHV